MATNPLGAVPIFDGANPRTFTGVARETISGGDLVVCSGAFNVVGSQAASFADGDIQLALVVDSERVNGIALHNVTSGNILAVASKGSFLIKTLGSVLQGTTVEAVNNQGVQSLTSGGVPSALYVSVPGGKNIGRAWTAAGSNSYALIDLNL